MAAMVETPDWAALDSDFAAGKRAIATADWEGAIKALTNASLRDARNADIQNYLGYTYRRLRQFNQAMHRYRRALILDPRHYGLWIDRGVQEPAELAEVLEPFPAERMAAYPVSTWVNDARHDDPRCLEPAA